MPTPKAPEVVLLPALSSFSGRASTNAGLYRQYDIRIRGGIPCWNAAFLIGKATTGTAGGGRESDSVDYEKETSFGKMEAGNATAPKTKGGHVQVDEQSLSHTKWKCQYHMVIVPKYRRKAIYGKLRQDIGVILRKLCEYKHVEIIEAHAMPDHIHMLLSIPPKLSVGDFMGYLKGKSTLMIFERHANMKYKYGRRCFWAKGYFVSTVGGNKAAIEKYIRNQETEDQMMDQLSFKEYEDPFKDLED